MKQDHQYSYVIFHTAFGYCGLLASKQGVSKTCMGFDDYDGCKTYLLVGMPEFECNPKLLPSLRKRLKQYFMGRSGLTFSDVDVDLSDLSPFARKVLHQCKKIKYGQTRSYADLAAKAGRPGASRAVGNIMGRNPCPIIIPCHRVIKSDGSPGGFMQNAPHGPALKRRLLMLENINFSSRKNSSYSG